jgi:hypothetical protein
VALNPRDSAAGVSFSDGNLVMRSSKGYRMARATHGVREGTFYFEVEVVRLGASGHLRVGWATPRGELQAPVGYDKFSYALRDVGGEKCHKSLREDYAREALAEGDVVGVLIHLPVGPPEKPMEYRRWKGEIYALPPPKDAEPPHVSGSLVAFARNGRALGVAYRDLYAGEYLPAASLFTDPDLQAESAELRFNFGPDFKHDRAAALPAGVEASVSPISELGSEPVTQEPGPSGQEKGQEGQARGAPEDQGEVKPLGTGEPPPDVVPAAGLGPGGAPAGGAGLDRADTVPDAT